MKTGVAKLFVAFVLLLLFHAMSLSQHPTFLGLLFGSWLFAAFLGCGIAGLVIGPLGAADLNRFLQSSQANWQKQQ